jgi:class 3 adenylate cyclase
MKHQPIRFEQERQYPMSVGEAWRILADTDHLNRSIGLPAVEFSPHGGEPLLRQARARAFLLLPVRWKEFPFDWVRERRYAVRREFDWGPIAWVEGGIELQPAAGGVNLKVFAHFTPKNLAGRFAWRLGRTPVTGLLEFCDRYLERRAAGNADPVPLPSSRPAVDSGRVDRLLAQLTRAPVQPELIPLLRERIVEGSDDQVVRVRPFALADAWSADRLEVLRLFLHATWVGLFELRWELMCPNCRIPKAEAGALAQLPDPFHCSTCGISYTADFDQRVELRFSVHPAVRSASNDIYCIGSPLRMPHVAAQQYLRPHEDRRVDLGLSAPLRLRTIGATHHLDVVPAPQNARVGEVKVTYAGGRWVGPHSLLHGESLALPDGACLTLRNQTEGPVLAVLEDVEWTGEAATAAQVATLQDFRDLFGSEVLAPGQHLAVRNVALLFSNLKGSTQRYEGIGDAAAFSQILLHFDFVREVVGRGDGAIVKTIGDGAMCAFHRLEDAVEAALAIQREIVPWCRAQAIEPPLTLRLGLHHGPAVASTANDRLDYFGRTVDLAASLRDESRGGDVVLLRETLEQLTPAPLEERNDIEVESFAVRMRGLGSERELVRLTPRPSGAEAEFTPQGSVAGTSA